MNNKSIHNKAKINKFLKKAEVCGLKDDYLFLTTLERYRVQVQILNDLRETIEAENTLVTKEYVKGRENLYTHPAITEFNKTTDSANKTVQTLDGLLKSKVESVKDKKNNPLLALMEDDSE